mgnify:CR=1 FL=1
MPNFYSSAQSSGDPDYIGALEQWDHATVRDVDAVFAWYLGALFI